jgi:hypothetical protein
LSKTVKKSERSSGPGIASVIALRRVRVKFHNFMTREQKIESIRAACIKANPEILAMKFGCKVDHGGDIFFAIRVDGDDVIYDVPSLSVKQRISVWNLKPLGRPIRLADVLSTIGNVKDKEGIVNVSHQGYFSISLPPQEHHPSLQWNLHTDDLTQQSDECIDFLANLLS